MSSAILHLARINLISTFNLGQNIVFSIFLSVLHFLYKQTCGLKTYIYTSPLLNPIHHLLLYFSCPGLSLSPPDLEKRAFGFVSCSLTIIPFIVGSGPRKQSSTLSQGSPDFIISPFIFQKHNHFLFSKTDYIHNFCHCIEHEFL